MGANRADAEDALGQTMLKALEKLPRFAGRIRCAEAWLLRLTRNLCRDLHRQRARGEAAVNQFGLLIGSSFTTPHQEPLLPADLDPEALIMSLPPALREVVLLRLIQRMAYKDIAVQLQLSSETARKRMQQAREVMRGSTGGERTCTTAVTAHHRGSKSVSADPFECRPNRAHQKIATLRAYVREHPTGWKKCLTLGDLLYVVGSLSEAADCYEHVLDRRPWLSGVSMRLEAIRLAIAER
jgi:DNA-directed RNA polymerase specialized sigma24 family protein